MENTALDYEKLISLLKEGDQKAFSTLYAHYSPQLLAKLHYLLSEEEQALEIHQHAFIKLWDYKEKIKVEDGMWPLLQRIARNLVVDYYRSSASQEAVKKALLLQATLYYELEEENEEVEALSEALHKAINLLPEKRREIFLLCKLQGKSYEEVAQLKGVSLGTVKDHMAKAMRFLRQELGQSMYSLLITLLTSIFS